MGRRHLPQSMTVDEFKAYREADGHLAVVGNNLGVWAQHCASGMRCVPSSDRR
jgi:hypothetical protein